jgi:hypothetical protein
MVISLTFTEILLSFSFAIYLKSISFLLIYNPYTLLLSHILEFNSINNITLSKDERVILFIVLLYSH